MNGIENEKVVEYQKVFEIANAYDSIVDFEKSSPEMFEIAKKEEWIERFTWFDVEDEERSDRRHVKWTRRLCFEIGKKYLYKWDFQRFDLHPYKSALRMGWLNEMKWFIPKPLDKYEYRKDFYCVYVYMDEPEKVCYIGLTNGIRKRHSIHKCSGGAVSKYFNSKNCEIPEPIILKEQLSASEAQYYEDLYVKEYKDKGWSLLNKGQTGVGVGSLGGNDVKYTFEKATEIAKQYTTLKDFRTKSKCCYSRCLKMGWLEQFPWLERNAGVNLWDEAKCTEIAKRYSTMASFANNEPTAHLAAVRHGWLKNFDWLYKHEQISWTFEMCLEIAQKYTTIETFRTENLNCYNACRRHDWLKEFTWLEHSRKPNGYWTIERAIEVSRSYTKLLTFRTEQATAYTLLLKEGLINTLTWLSTEREPDYWTLDEVILHASRYSKLKDFMYNDKYAYEAALRHGYLDKLDFLEREIAPKGYWTEERIMNEAMSYKSFREFKEQAPKCYAAANSRHMLPRMTWLERSRKPNGYWTKDKILEEALNYRNASEFDKNNRTAYSEACKLGILKELIYKK